MSVQTETERIKTDWNSMAKAYEEFNNSPDSYSFNIEWTCIRNILPALDGKTIVDLGCGTGIFTFLLEHLNPKSITGIDLSAEMLEIAKEKAAEKSSRAIFFQCDALDCAERIDEAVDFVFSSTTSHYIRDLGALLKNVYGILKPGGVAVFSVIHPLYSALYPIANGGVFPKDEDWGIRYLNRSRRTYVQPWLEYNDNYESLLSMSYHHTFSDYTNAIIESGLIIEGVYEPEPPDEWERDQPSRYENYVETPVYLIFKMKKHL